MEQQPQQVAAQQPRFYRPRVLDSVNDLKTYYKIEEECGEGGYGKVFRAVSNGVEPCKVPAGEAVAIKTVEGDKLQDKTPEQRKQNPSPSNLDLLKREVNIFSQLDHPNIVKFREAIFVPSLLHPTKVFIVMEYIDRGTAPTADLFPAVAQDAKHFLDEDRARRYFQQLMEAIRYLHDVKNCAHRDVKLENLLLDRTNDVAKLCDFTFAKLGSDGDLMTADNATSEYCSYEVAVNKSRQLSGLELLKYQKQVDLWSCGVTLFVMLAGRYPFGARGKTKESLRALYDNILSLNYQMSSKFSREAADLIGGLLRKPEDRISLEAVFKHPWFLADYKPSLDVGAAAGAPAAAAQEANEPLPVVAAHAGAQQEQQQQQKKQQGGNEHAEVSTQGCPCVLM